MKQICSSPRGGQRHLQIQAEQGSKTLESCIFASIRLTFEIGMFVANPLRMTTWKPFPDETNRLLSTVLHGRANDITVM